MANRKEVYIAIDTERDYQDKMQGNSARTNVDDNRDQGSLILLAEHYMQKLREAHAGPNSLGSEIVTGNARKVAALLVMLMERFGAPKRVVA